MDNIDRIMREAERLGFGVSYGKYRAACYASKNAPVQKKPKPKLPAEEPASCMRCGKVFWPRHGNQIYCGPECSDAAFRDKQRDFYKKKSKMPESAVCVICGATFKPKVVHAKCCGPACSKENRRRSERQWRASHKKED